MGALYYYGRLFIWGLQLIRLHIACAPQRAAAVSLRWHRKNWSSGKSGTGYLPDQDQYPYWRFPRSPGLNYVKGFDQEQSYMSLKLAEHDDRCLVGIEAGYRLTTLKTGA